MNSFKNKIQLHCDGACQGNPGDGGWAFILKFNIKGMKKEDYPKSGYVPGTTNNRMELQSCIEGLNTIYSYGIPRVDEIEILSDSQYLISTMTQGWKKGKNTDLWNVLDGILSKLSITYNNLNINWKWVKGHSGNEYNELCDKMAVKAYKEKLLPNLNGKNIVEDGEKISITFTHIMKYTYSNQVIDIYEHTLSDDGEKYYASEMNGKELCGISETLKGAQLKAEQHVRKFLI